MRGEPEGGAREPGEERELERLIVTAGPRPAPTAAELGRLRAAAESEWRRLLATRPSRPRRSVPALALAAMLLLAVVATAWWTWQRSAAPGASVATVAAWRGSASWRGAGAAALAPGLRLDAGGTLETAADGLVALAWDGGTSVRIGPDSRLRLDSPAELRLERGAVYVDGGTGGGGGRRLAIATPYGLVREIGTQYQVRLTAGGGLRVDVREGGVVLERAGAAHPVAAGEALVVDAAGDLGRQPIPRHGTLWTWVAAAGPSFDLEGRTLAEFLAWAAREGGWQLDYAAPRLAAEARTIRLHGSVAGLALEDAVAAVVAGAGWVQRLDGGRLAVGRAGDAVRAD